MFGSAFAIDLYTSSSCPEITSATTRTSKPPPAHRLETQTKQNYRGPLKTSVAQILRIRGLDAVFHITSITLPASLSLYLSIYLSNTLYYTMYINVVWLSLGFRGIYTYIYLYSIYPSLRADHDVDTALSPRHRGVPFDHIHCTPRPSQPVLLFHVLLNSFS